jgi:hypothetical protein
MFKAFFWREGVRAQERNDFRRMVRAQWMTRFHGAAANSKLVSLRGFPFAFLEWPFGCSVLGMIPFLTGEA